VAFGAAIMTGPVAKADTYDAMFEATDWLARKYGVIAYTNHQWMEYGTYAVTVGDTITFNTGYVENPDILRRDLTADVIAGYHRGANCTPEQYVAAHEFAHVLDNLTGHTADYELDYALANGLSGEVSTYALESYDEAIAEAFAAVECDAPTPAEQAIYDMLVY
jgi:hypothetical protein